MSIPVQDVFDAIAAGIASDPSVVNQVKGVFHFKVGGKSWTVDLKNGAGSVKSGAPSSADCTLTVGDEDFVKLMTGEVNGQSLFSKPFCHSNNFLVKGKLKIQGNMGLAMKLDKIPKVPKGGAKAPAGGAAKSSGGLRSEAVFDVGLIGLSPERS